MYKDYLKFYSKYKDMTYSETVVAEAKKEWDLLTNKFFNRFSKEEIIDGLESMWTLFNNDTKMLEKEEQWDIFLQDLYYYMDRMNINRWCRLQLLLGNSKSH